MSDLLIKICGVRSPKLAYQAALAGADFIGIVFHPKSSRCVGIGLAREIALSTKAGGAKPIAVFVEQTSSEMQRICETSEIEAVQLHGSTSRQQQDALPVHYQRIHVQSIYNPSAVACHTLRLNTSIADPKRDYLLFDHPDPGQGILFDWTQLQYSGPYRIGLAGGLTAQNVANAVLLEK